MKATGRVNKFTGNEIFQAEVQDVNWEKSWSDLTLDEKIDFCSFASIKFLGDSNALLVEALFEQTKFNLGYKKPE